MGGVPYPGMTPSNVLRDAKYRVVGDDPHIEVQMQIDRRTKAVMTTQAHPRLVEMVNEVKRQHSGTERGSFYINEFGHVIVPDIEGRAWYAGSYDVLLEFDLEGETVSPVAPPGLNPGDPWPGHRVGTGYTLAAGGQDVYFEQQEGQYRKTICLSELIGAAAAQRTASKVASVKGSSGGGFFINEAFELFAPLTDEDDGQIVIIYAGKADEADWFPPPAV